MKKIIMFFSLLFICSNIFATEILLKNGVVIEGTIIELTNDYVRIDKGNDITYRLKFEDIDESSLTILKDMPLLNAASVNLPTTLTAIEEQQQDVVQKITPLVNSVTLEIPQDLPTEINEQPEINSLPNEIDTLSDTENKKQENITRSSSVQLIPAQNTTITTNTTPTDSKTKIKIPPAFIGLGIIFVFIMIFILHAILLGIPLSIIAKKTGTSHPWIAFIPLINNFTMCAVAGKPWWWAILLLLPFLGFIFYVVIWMKISEIRHQSKWLGFLFLVPIINIIFIWYLSFDPKIKLATPPQESSVK